MEVKAEVEVWTFERDKHHVELRIGHQEFRVGGAFTTRRGADWYARQLRHALKKLTENADATSRQHRR